MAVLAVVGNMITTWSWFGTNQLGVGLHAYGFSNTLAAVCVSLWWVVRVRHRRSGWSRPRVLGELRRHCRSPRPTGGRSSRLAGAAPSRRGATGRDVQTVAACERLGRLRLPTKPHAVPVAPRRSARR